MLEIEHLFEKITPEAIAKHSPRVRRASEYIRQTANSLQNATFQQAVKAMLGGPEQKSVSLFSHTDRRCKKMPLLCAALDAKGSSWWSSPGAAANSHHPYPGGWLIHNATNLSALSGLLETALHVRGVTVDADLARGAMLLHDWAKPSLLRWDGWQICEAKAELGHHVIALAEAALRALPDELLIGMAGIHAGWWGKPETVARFLEQAAEATDIPRIARLAKDASTHRWSQLSWTLRQGEVAWYQAAKDAVHFVRAPLQEWSASQFPNSNAEQIMAITLGWVDELELAELYSHSGMAVLAERANQALQETAASLTITDS